MGDSKLSRSQRRDKERREEDAKRTYETLAEKFTNYFVGCDNPESEEVEERRRQMNAQWRVFCKKMNLIPAAYVMFDEYSKGLIKEYHESKIQADATPA